MSPSAIDNRLIACVLSACAACAGAQEGVEFSAQNQADAYLVEHGLDRVLAARLRARLKSAQGEERARVADELGRVYARQLEAVEDQQSRQSIELLCRELIDSVPDVESFGLRIELARTLYLSVESDAEGARMLLSTPEQDAETVRVLRVVTPQFELLARKLQSECDRLQKRMDAADDPDANALRSRLEEYRGFRSRAAYYAGWSSYYLSLLENDQRRAIDALEAFGIILGAVPGNSANLERVNKGFIRFPHYARSMIGCALASSKLGKDVEALRWLDAVSVAEDSPPEVTQQLFARYAIVLAESERWSDLAVRMRAHRERQGSAGNRLSKSEARLLAVLSLRAAAQSGLLPRTRQMTEEIAQTALSDLVASGEVAHVRDLFRRFGTAPIAESGFVALYLRGSDSFEKARESHVEAGTDPNEPVLDPEIITNYRAGAALLRSAIASADASSYPGELSRAMVRCGLALYFAGDLIEAADQLERASGESGVESDRKEALWFAIVAVDRAVRGGKPTLRERCDKLAAEYVRRHPGTERSVSLLSRLVKSGTVDDESAIKTLLEVASDSPMYLTARSEAVSRLYAKFSKSSAQDRDVLALRIADIGEEVIKRYHEIVTGPDHASAVESSDRLILRSRQIVDALLSMSSPDHERASSVLALISSTAERLALDMTALEPELCYHRFRIALASADRAEEQRSLNRLIALASADASARRFIDACEAQTLQRAWERCRASDFQVDLAREVVGIAGGMIARSDGSLTDRMRGVYAKAAEAAFAVWKSTGEAVLRDSVVAWDGKLIAEVRNVQSLRRLALCAESLNQHEQALTLWSDILAGTAEREGFWYEARIGSIRMLLVLRPDEAVAALRQHQVLYPDPAPEPWFTEFERLERRCRDLPNSTERNR